MKIQNKKAFSLIEVVVSSIILSLTVFGVYKLIAENNKIINNSNNYLDANIMIENTISCVNNLSGSLFPSFSTNTGSFYFENSLTGKCLTGAYDFTGVTLNNVDYYLYGKIITSTSDYFDWIIGVHSDQTGKIEKEYKVWK